ncbi:ribonuclease H-like domain-containing protein [Peribacillus sp. SCS-155]|uniref:ribonuclease H-like domain-containing protein n=1 Tax=Peribacillus sedimenti TaxID=3115297 RepID=UPI0039067F5A
MSLKNKLGRMKSHLSLDPNKEMKTTESMAPSAELNIPFLDKWERNHTSLYHFDGGHCFIREVRYPLDYQHGIYSFKEVVDIVSLWNQGELAHPLSARGLEAGDLFFFDTETTGLGGGVGNTIFLLGYAFIDGEEVVVRQHVLPQPGNEIPLYQSFLEKIDYNTLVTYNGKAFDWPQLKTRHTLIRDHIPKLPEFGHFDLYHASRRLWKDQLEKVKLSAVEEEILGLKRENDIPGYLAPMIYFDFVERKDPDILFGVLQHNETDILSLITLYIHLSKQILQVDGYGSETLKIAKWLDYLGKKEEAYHAYDTVLSAGSEAERLSAKHAMAYYHKKQKKYDDALAIWKEVSEKGNGKERMEAIIECAKLLEHQYRNFEQAFHNICGFYLEIRDDKAVSDSVKQNLLKRMERLRGKLNRAGMTH